MNLTFERLADAMDIDGTTAVEQNWKATDTISGASISKAYPIVNTQASIEADLTAVFPVNPVPPVDAFVSLKAIKVGNAYKILDENNNPLFELERDSLGNAHVALRDSNGSKRRVLTPQAGTIKSDATSTIADVAFEDPFEEHPVINLTPSKPLPNYELKVNKTGFTMDFATPPATTIAWSAKSNKK